MKVKSESEVTQSCPTLNDLMDCSLPGSSVHGICQARVLEWVAIAFSVPGAQTLINFTIFLLNLSNLGEKGLLLLLLSRFSRVRLCATP